MNKRAKGAIRGIVQGVGFRPFIYQLSLRFHLTGYVVNTPSGVDLEVEGPEQDLERFVKAMRSEPPSIAHIASTDWKDIPVKHEKSFEIKKSLKGDNRSTLISPDVSVCPACLSEMRDPKNRRFRYPFINCTNCGPRYTIIRDMPYDRATTTMNEFMMCPVCREEYDDPNNRRFHAQPNACWECGPITSLFDASGNRVTCADPVKEAISLLKDGSVVALKGLGGFHLAVDALNHRAVVRLRRRKQREEKPLAIMVKDLSVARKIAHVDDVEAGLLISHQRPIVILKGRRFHGLSPQVAPKNKNLGIILPYTPLHYLLMDVPFEALVMTSANMTEEPIIIDDQEAFTRLDGIADYFLTHNRAIHMRSDDSILRVVGKIPRQTRRSRGFVPFPVFLSGEIGEFPSVLAVGGELKNTVCLTKKNRVFLSQHIGDMENLKTYESFLLAINHLKQILEIHPKVIAHDLHPDYLSSKFAKEQQGLHRLVVQHHHAHIVSCLAEHGHKGPVIGVAVDGNGLGPDGRIWGGEILLSDLTSFRRTAHLDYVALPGGDVAARSPWRMALVHLDRAYGDELFNLEIPFVQGLDQDDARIILKMVRQGINSPLTSSCGRLFDAVSSLLGLRQRIAYEGQAAVELEMCQDPEEKGYYHWNIKREGDGWVITTTGIIRGIVEDIKRGKDRGGISRRFHNTLIKMLGEACVKTRQESGVDTVALSGGSFQNATLLGGLTSVLTGAGFAVLSHSRVPTNDGSLCLGQAVCAGLRHIGFRGEFEEYSEVYR